MPLKCLNEFVFGISVSAVPLAIGGEASTFHPGGRGREDHRGGCVGTGGRERDAIRDAQSLPGAGGPQGCCHPDAGADRELLHLLGRHERYGEWMI